MVSDRWTKILMIVTSVTLIARGWLTWRFESPVLIHLPNFSSDNTAVTAFFGTTLILAGFCHWFGPLSWKRFWLIVSVIILLLDSYARWVGKDYQFGMAIEHALQFGTPILMLMALHRPFPAIKWKRVALIAAAMTFVGHACYAMGIHPVPGSYLAMTERILSTGEGASMTFLKIAGVLDVVAAIIIFIPRLQAYGLIYMVFWGGATALARVVSHIGIEKPGFGLDPWLAETLVRTPHWAMPLLILLLIRNRSNENTSKAQSL